MQDEAEVNYRYEVRFPLAEIYDVEDVLNLISDTGYSQLYIEPIENAPFISARWADKGEGNLQLIADEIRTREQIRKQQAKELNKNISLMDQKTYLLHQLVKAFVDKKLKLWDWSNGRIIDTSEASKFAHVLAESLSPTRATFSMLIEPETIPLHPIQPTYLFIYLWATKYQVTKTDLCNFCKSLHIRIKFEAAQTQALDYQETLSDIQDPPKERWRLADYNQLADAFKILIDPNANLAWFKNRCSDYKKYAIFKDAIHKKGSQGPGKVSLFDVIKIASHFESNSALKNKRRNGSDYFNPANYKQYLRSRIEAHFLPLLDEFDDRFGTGNGD